MTVEFASFYFDDPIVDGRAVDFFLPSEISQEVALFFVHGGGWRAGSRTSFHRLITEYNKHGFICASSGYRLSGVTALEQLSDLRCAYNLFTKKLCELNQSPRIMIIGTSAGAHLAALLTLTVPGECGEVAVYDDEWIKPCGAALQSTPVTFEPWEDIFPAIWASMQNIAGTPYASDSKIYKQLSPVTYLKSTNPPLFFLEAENEHMFPSDMTLNFTKQHNALGIPSRWKKYTHTEHGFFYDLTRWQQREAFDDIKVFAESL